MASGFSYHWDESHLFAVKAAITARRPLLVRGEPGVGKSSLARAAAKKLKRHFISETITARTEPNDLLWQFDGVQRLSDAQVSGKLTKDPLDKQNYIAPGVLWWAYQPQVAKGRYGVCSGSCCPSPDVMKAFEKETGSNKPKSWVVLIDEIDKADSDVPNSLLDAFGENSFPVPHVNERVTLDKGLDQPLIIITTNEDRQLPPAFLRRCFVLHMGVPATETEAVDWLLDRAAPYEYFGLGREALKPLAEIIVTDRQGNLGPHRPGLSEFLDFARVVAKHPDSLERKAEDLRTSFDFILSKNAR